MSFEALESSFEDLLTYLSLSISGLLEIWLGLLTFYLRSPEELPKPFQLSAFNFQLYSFNLNLQFHDSFHPRIGEPNRGGERDTNLKKEKKKRTILQTVPAVAK